MEAYNKLEELKKIIKNLGKVVVAFSGGADSTFLLKVCLDELGKENVVAITAESEIYSKDEIEFSKKIAKEMGVKHYIIKTEEMKNENFITNPVDRCYYCKLEIFSKLREEARKMNINYILEGSTIDDLEDYRPGGKAVREMKVLSPLQMAKLSKKEIRYLSKEMGLPTWDKPPQACLASRFPYGYRITIEELRMVEKAEKFLKENGFEVVRVRHYGKLARIEVDEKDIEKFFNKDFRKRVLNEFRKLGYIWVCLDLAGYRTGSMNECLRKGFKQKCLNS